MQIPSPVVEPTQQTIKSFIDCMEEGNRRYDSSGCRGFLSVYDAIATDKRGLWGLGLQPFYQGITDNQISIFCNRHNPC